ncbi:MAG: glycosyltransferase family 2 protein [Pseudomonadota bacterium]
MPKTSEKTPFFSIITITLNNVEGLRRTHKSLKKQNFTNFEWIIIDGKSSDKTLEYLKQSDAKITSEPDAGIYDAMNKGINKSTGEYLLFLNAGDILCSADTLKRIHKASQDKPDFIYGDSLEASSYKPARKPDIARGMFTHHQAMLYKREALGGLKYNTAYEIAADYDFTAKFLNPTKTLKYCEFPICDFELGGISQTKAALGRREQFEIRRNLKLVGPIKNYVITALQAALWTLRCCAPALYWRLKSSGNSAPVIAQSDSQHSRLKNPT